MRILIDKIYDEVYDFIIMETSAELDIKPNTKINANDVISRIDRLPFIYLGELWDVLTMIISYDYDDKKIEERYPAIAKTLRDPNKKGDVAIAMWDNLLEAEDTHVLVDIPYAESRFAEFLAEVNDRLKK